MIKTIIKLAVAALIANAAWRMGSAYMTFYRFKDAVTEAAQYSKGKSEDELRQRVFELASNYDVPLSEDAVAVRRQDNHTLVDASYTQPVDVLPGYRYQWPLAVNIDTFTIIPIKPSDVINPQ
jgi:hypothetical protein